MLSLGRVGSPKPHRPPTFHLGSAPATGTDREHPRACLRSIKAPGWEAARAGAAEKSGAKQQGPSLGGPKGAPQEATSPPRTHPGPTLPLGAPAEGLRGGHDETGGTQEFCAPSPSFYVLPPPPCSGCQQTVEQSGSIPEQTLTSP